MRKLDATLINGNNKEDVILKIKDDSFAITTSEQIIKIPYSNIKNYSYDTKNGILSIIKYGGNPVELKIAKDKQLLESLSNIVIQNKNNNSKESSSKTEKTITKEKEIELEEKTTIKENEKTKIEVENKIETSPQNTPNTNQNNGNNPSILKIISGIISVIVLIILCTNMCSGSYYIEGGSKAEQYALTEIPEKVPTLLFEAQVTSNELKCEAKEKTDDEIILVKCTTTNKFIKEYFDSETIWYAYQETADGMSHYRAISNNKDEALKNIRDK